MQAFVIGLDHWVQRNQDDNPERNLVRRSFGRSIRTLIEQETIQLVAEEAGNDEQVAACLQREEDIWAPFEGRPPRTTQAMEPIAKNVAERIRGCRHADIRPDKDCADAKEYEQEMISRMSISLGNAVRILMLCGEAHRGNLSRSLQENSWDVESHDIDWLLNSYGRDQNGYEVAPIG